MRKPFEACLAYFIIIFQLFWVVLAVSVVRLPSLPLTNDPFKCVNQTYNLSLPNPKFNYTVLPPDEYTYQVPNTLITVTFYDYSKPLPEACVQICITKAVFDVKSHMHELEQIIGRSLEYKALGVVLTLNPWSMMTWDMWDATTQGLRHFMDITPPVGLDFDVEKRDRPGMEPYLIGTGRLAGSE